MDLFQQIFERLPFHSSKIKMRGASGDFILMAEEKRRIGRCATRVVRFGDGFRPVSHIVQYGQAAKNISALRPTELSQRYG